MKSRTLLTLAIVALLAGSLAAPLSAQRGYGPPGGAGMGPAMAPGMGAILSDLELTAEQEAAIESIRDQYGPGLQATREDLQDKRHALFSQAHAQELDEGAIRELGAQLGNAEAESVIVMSRMRLEIHGILTAEQLAQLEEIQQERSQRWGQKGQRGQRGQRATERPGSSRER